MAIIPPLWRYFVADLAGSGITDYSKLASDRVVEVILNGPLSMTGRAPSDNPQVWIPYDGDGYDDPYLDEGTRLMWGFRRESSTPPYYTVRAATVVQFVSDDAEQDDARTLFQGWDPWHYLFSRPACNADGSLPGEGGLQYVDTQVSTIIAQLLENTIVNQGHAFVDAGVTYGGTASWNGVLETAAGMAVGVPPDPPYVIAQGTSVGQAWQQLTALGICDIILNPIYDPLVRPNYLVDLSVYAQAGETRDEAIFAWNAPGRSLVGISRQQDGSQRANDVAFFAGQGGSKGVGTPQLDAASIAKFGNYFAQQFFPAEATAAGVTSLAAQQLALRKTGRQTVTFRPAPGRSPRPGLDYGLGDRVPVWVQPQGFRKLLGEAG